MYDTILDAQSEWFEKNLTKVLASLQQKISAMFRDYETVNGILVNSDPNALLAYQSYQNLQKLLNESGYSQLVQKAQEKENDILRYMRENRPTGAIPFAFTQQTAEKLQGLSAIYATNFASVAATEMRGIQGVIVRSVMAGIDSEKAINEIRDILSTRLQRYATTYFNTSRGDFIQAVEYANAAEYDGELYWEYQGPSDDLTRPACVVGLGIEASSSYPNAPFYTDAERQAFEAETAGERLYNCRHDFIQITEEYYNENTGGNNADKK